MSTAAEKKKLSKTPSWIMLGFVLGVLAVLGLQTDGDEKTTKGAGKAPPVPAAPVPPPERNVTALDNRPSLVAIEAVFAQFRDFVFWENDVSEVALWNSATRGFSDHFEVIRSESGTIFFRSIPRFTRLPLDNYGPPGSPLRFTETETMRAQREARAAGPQPVRPPEPLTFPTSPPPEPSPERP